MEPRSSSLAQTPSQAASSSPSQTLLPIPWPSFPAASPADVVRASEKDDLYLDSLCDSLAEALRGLGGRWSHVAAQGEGVRLAARLAYHVLTTGAGRQTLGEEYCSILQASDPSGTPTTFARRTLFVLLHTLAPYLLLRLNAAAVRRGSALHDLTPTVAADSAAAVPQDPREAQRASAPDPNRNSSPGRDVASQSAALPAGVEEVGTSRSPDSCAQAPSPSSNSHPGLRPSHLAPHQPTSRGPPALSRMLIAWAQAQPALTELATLLDRTHLMFFYFHGQYYHWAKRAVGIRHIFTGRPGAEQSSYAVLGLLLLLQVGLQGLDWASRTVLRPVTAALLPPRRRQMHLTSHALEGAGKGSSQQQQQVPGDGGDEGWISLEGPSTYSPARDDPPASLSPFDEPSSAASRCSLCLESRRHPTSTPCGHVFCWQCIAEWCNEKQECPLCRAPTVHSSLVLVYHSDF